MASENPGFREAFTTALMFISVILGALRITLWWLTVVEEKLWRKWGSWQHSGFPSLRLTCWPGHISGLSAPLALHHVYSTILWLPTLHWYLLGISQVMAFQRMNTYF